MIRQFTRTNGEENLLRTTKPDEMLDGEKRSGAIFELEKAHKETSESANGSQGRNLQVEGESEE